MSVILSSFELELVYMFHEPNWSEHVEIPTSRDGIRLQQAHSSSISSSSKFDIPSCTWTCQYSAYSAHLAPAKCFFIKHFLEYPPISTRHKHTTTWHQQARTHWWLQIYFWLLQFCQPTWYLAKQKTGNGNSSPFKAMAHRIRAYVVNTLVRDVGVTWKGLIILS